MKSGPRIVVVGAGPAGLMAAIAAAEAADVLLLDQMARPGLKLLASGGGRCNLTNTLAPAAFMERFGRQGRFMQPALAALDAAALRRFLESLGVPTHSPDGLLVYPTAESGAPVLSALKHKCSELGAVVKAGSPVTGLAFEGGRVSAVSCGELIRASAVILATGGKTYHRLGGSGTGYELAREAGHAIVDPCPALVPLVTRETWPSQLAGVSLQDAVVRIDLPGRLGTQVRGAVLFTHKGLSGPAVLDLSGTVSRSLLEREYVPLKVIPTPGIAVEDWQSMFRERAGSHGKKTLLGALAGVLPRSLAQVVCALAGVDSGIRCAHLTAVQRDRVIGQASALSLTVTSTEGFENAMVTRGGVALKDIDPRTLGSRLVRGLFFAGEMLDLDGPSGGFNLQWAFSSGHLAGSAASSFVSGNPAGARQTRV